MYPPPHTTHSLLEGETSSDTLTRTDRERAVEGGGSWREKRERASEQASERKRGGREKREGGREGGRRGREGGREGETW
jgi:hypothetical protein